QLADAPVPALAREDDVHMGQDALMRIRRACRQPGLPEDLQVIDIIAHIGHLLHGDLHLRQPPAEHLALGFLARIDALYAEHPGPLPEDRRGAAMAKEGNLDTLPLQE